MSSIGIHQRPRTVAQCINEDVHVPVDGAFEGVNAQHLRLRAGAQEGEETLAVDAAQLRLGNFDQQTGEEAERLQPEHRVAAAARKRSCSGVLGMAESMPAMAIEMRASVRKRR